MFKANDFCIEIKPFICCSGDKWFNKIEIAFFVSIVIFISSKEMNEEKDTFISGQACKAQKQMNFNVVISNFYKK